MDEMPTLLSGRGWGRAGPVWISRNEVGLARGLKILWGSGLAAIQGAA